MNQIEDQFEVVKNMELLQYGTTSFRNEPLASNKEKFHIKVRSLLEHDSFDFSKLISILKMKKKTKNLINKPSNKTKELNLLFFYSYKA